MRWTKSRTRQALVGAGLLFLSGSLLLCIADRQLQLMVYAPQKSYSVEVQDRDGRLYINVIDLLSPLGNTNVQSKNKEWKLTFNGADAVFNQGSENAKVRGKSVRLGGKTLIDNDKVLIPLAASFPVVSALLKVQVELHPDARRLFIDNTVTRFTAELKKSDRPLLLLNFDHPVSPVVSQEEGKVKLTFKREPVISDISTQPWEDKNIQSLAFTEDNGAAILTISGATGLNASVTGDGRSVLVQVPPPPAAASAPPPPTSPATATTAPPSAPAAEASTPQLPFTNQTHSGPVFFVMIDAGHGGDDPGARLSEKLAEKDVTLTLARKIKAELQERGIAVRLMRDTDVSMSLEQRAETTNEQRAGVYVAIHAGIPGGGVRVYAPAFGTNSGAGQVKFLPWENAQENYVPRSRTLAKGIAGELDKRNITATILRASLRPLNNINAPAIGIELAGDPDNVQDITEQKFQNTVATAIAVGIAQLRGQLEGQR